MNCKHYFARHWHKLYNTTTLSTYTNPAYEYMHMLWFQFILGLMFFELVSILFAIVPDYGNEYMTKENNN